MHLAKILLSFSRNRMKLFSYLVQTFYRIIIFKSAAVKMTIFLHEFVSFQISVSASCFTPESAFKLLHYFLV